jgi:hypothetical protein
MQTHFRRIVRDKTLRPKWLAILVRIRQVSGSNLGPETGYTEANVGITANLKVGNDRFLPNTFQFIIY